MRVSPAHVKSERVSTKEITDVGLLRRLPGADGISRPLAICEDVRETAKLLSLTLHALNM